MKPAHPIVKIVTAVFFITVMFGFVAYRGGAFEDEQKKMPDMNHALMIKSRQAPTSSSSSPSAPVKIDPMKNALERERSQQMMFSSKSMILVEPAGVTLTMMSSSKSSTVFVPDLPIYMSLLAGSMNHVPKADERPVIKQKK